MNNTNKIIYISSDLEIIEEYNNTYFAKQVLINDKGFTVLTPEVYSWLRQRMEKAHTAYKAGKLAEQSWNALRERFYPVHDWAVQAWGNDAIEKLLESPQKNPFAVFKKPMGAKPKQDDSYLYPVDGDWPCIHPVLPDAIAKVDAIKDKAISLGWSEARLYQNRGRFKFPLGGDYGLVCFVGKNDSLGEVTRQFIEIFRTSGMRKSRLCFYNADTDLPWIKKITKKEN